MSLRLAVSPSRIVAGSVVPGTGAVDAAVGGRGAGAVGAAVEGRGAGALGGAAGRRGGGRGEDMVVI